MSMRGSGSVIVPPERSEAQHYHSRALNACHHHLALAGAQDQMVSGGPCTWQAWLALMNFACQTVIEPYRSQHGNQMPITGSLPVGDLRSCKAAAVSDDAAPPSR